MDQAVAKRQKEDRNFLRPEAASKQSNITLPSIAIKRVHYAKLKRAFDVAASLVGLVLALPLFFVVALMIRVTSPGPILFKQNRVGAGGRLFPCFKFRSMYMDAEARRAEIEHLNEMNGPVFKVRQDPRITPVGRWIRKFSLDELPQLLNVLQGDMSVVGPRPPIPAEVAAYTERQRGRLAVKPGLTCIWQVSGRSNVDFDQWIEMDLRYIETMTFARDLAIICRTIPAVLTGIGAH